VSARRTTLLLALLALVGCKRKQEATALQKGDGEGKTHECKLVAGGRITQDTVIQAGCLVTVSEPYTIANGANLKIEAGARFAFKKGARLLVEDGSITAQGQKLQPIVFTSAEPKPAAGDWGGLLFVSARPSSLEEVVVEWAGDEPKVPTTAADAKAAALADAAELGAIGLLGSSGFRVGSRSPLLDRRPALYLGRLAKLSIIGGAIRHSKKVGIAADGDTPFERVDRVELDDNGGYAMDVPASALGAVVSLASIEPVRVRGSVNTTQSWPKVDLVVASLEVVSKEKGGAVVLTLASETIVRVEPKTSLRFGGYSEGGAIVAKKVRFTSAAPRPAPGDWAGIHFQKRAPGTRIEESIVEFAGYEDPPPPSAKPKTKGEKPRPKPAALFIQEWMKDFEVLRTTFRDNAGPGMARTDSYYSFGFASGTGGCEGLDAGKNGNKSIGQPLCEYHEDSFAKIFEGTGPGAFASDPGIFGGEPGGIIGTPGGLSGSGYGGGGYGGGAIAGPGGGGIGKIGGTGSGVKTKP